MTRSLISLAALALVACGPPDDRDKAPKAGAVHAATSASRGDRISVTPQQRSFRDWRAVCDNGLRCAADTGSDEGGWLMVRMDAGPDARPEVLAGMMFAESDAKTLRLAIDGGEIALTSASDGRSATAPAPAVADLLDRLASAETLQLRAGATEAVDLPTAGASAALLWIDEQQGRLETTTALLRRGGRPASAVPAPPALPEVTVANAARAPVDQAGMAGAADPGEDGDRAGIALPKSLEALEEVKTCRAETAFNAYLQKAVLAARLDDDLELWGVPCSGGAYNAGYALYVTGSGGANPRGARFPTWEPRRTEGDISGDWLTNPVYDPKTRTISHFPRGRGIGDCGVQQSWVWTGGAFVLSEEKVMGECWGMSSDLWPSTWRSR